MSLRDTFGKSHIIQELVLQHPFGDVPGKSWQHPFGDVHFLYFSK